MFLTIKRAFLILNNNLILSQPFVLYLLVAVLAFGAVASGINPSALIILIFSMVFLSVAFLAGWFYMDKKVIEYEITTTLEGDEKAIGSVSLFKEFFPGVGEYFLPVLGSLILYFAALALVFWGFYEIGLREFGAPGFDLNKINEASKSYLAMKSYVASLPQPQVILLLKWILYISFFSFVFQAATMWWFAPLYYDTKNPFRAMLLAFKFFVSNFAPSLGIFVFLGIFNIFVSAFNSLAGNNLILLFLSFILYFYYVTYYIVLIFLYYGEKNGYYSYSRSDGNGQEQPFNTPGEEA